MLKPKAHNFKLKVMLSKLEAVSNKVTARCHASLRVDGEELPFKVTPELKKNVAVFNSEIETQNLSIQFDQATNIYEGKMAIVQFQLETQGTKVKIGEVQLNLGAILNQKKYRVVNSFPLAKCYDKTAKAKICVDFMPLPGVVDQPMTHRQGSQRQASQTGLGAGLGVGVGAIGSGWKQTVYKSRLAQGYNQILQEKIYEYQQKMDNYRLSQTQLQERLHEQISNKDHHIAELTTQLSRKASEISALTLELEQLRFRLKQAGDEISASKESNRSLMSMLQAVQHEQQDLKKEVQVLKASIDNLSKVKDSKEKHYAVQISKYTQRYMESQQERNKIIFQLEAKFKQEIDRKELSYSTLITNNDKKYTEAINTLKQRIKELQIELTQRNQLLQKQVEQSRRLSELLAIKSKELSDTHQLLKETSTQKQHLQTSHSHLTHQLDTLNFSYQQCQRQVIQFKEEVSVGRRACEQLRMQLQMANQTIQQQRKTLSKYSKQLQVHQQRAYYLAEKYNDQLEIKSQQEHNIRGESLYYKEELHRLASQLRLAKDHAEQQALTAEQLREALARVEGELAARGQAVVRGGEQLLQLETENRTLREQLSEMEEAVLMLKQENLQLGDILRRKEAAQETDKSLEWSYKIEELQMDISQMVEKFKIERENFHRDDVKRREQIAMQAGLLRRAREQTDELRRILTRKDVQIKEQEQTAEQLRILSKQRAEEVTEGRQKMRIYAAEIEELQARIRDAEQRQAAKLREIEQRHQRDLKSSRKAETLKGSFSKALTHLLDYLTRPLTASPLFQELLLPDLDPEITNMVNLALKKHCQQRTKIKQTIKRLQGQSFFKSDRQQRQNTRLLQQQTQERRLVSEASESILRRTYFKDESESPWKLPIKSPKDSSQADSLREDNARLKRELSQLRVKVKQLEEEAGRAERNADSERYSREAARQQVEDIQDELEKVSFQLKRKEKLIQEYEAEMRQMQAELLMAKAQPVSQPASKTPSRIQTRKQDNAQSSRNAVVLRDLQNRLQQKSKENEQLLNEVTRLKGQSSTQNQIINNLRSEIKLLEGRLKEKIAKVISIEQQFVTQKAALEEQHHQAALLQQKRIADLEEAAALSQQEARRCQLAVSNLERQLGEAEKRNRNIKQQARLSQGRVRRQGQQVQSKLKETIQQQERAILTLQSQVQQLTLRNKQVNSRLNNLTALLSKKAEEADRQAELLTSRSNQLIQVQQQKEEYAREQERRIIHLVERLQQAQNLLQEKDYELQQYRFTSQGKLMDLEKRLEQAVMQCQRAKGQ